MKLSYRKLYDHPKVRDGVAFFQRLSALGPGRAAAADASANGTLKPAKGRPGKKAAPNDPRKQFRAIVDDELLKRNDRWKPLAASLDKRLPDPLEQPELVAYGAALVEAAKAFESAHGCARDSFLTENERRACDLSAALGDVATQMQAQVQSFAADMNLAPRGGERDPNAPYKALQLLALYRVATPEQQERVFELADYSAEKRLDVIAELLAYMENGFSRAEAVEYLRRRAFVPATLAQLALAKNVLAEGYVSSDESAVKFVQTMRSAYVPDGVIGNAWCGARFEPSFIERALV